MKNKSIILGVAGIAILCGGIFLGSTLKNGDDSTAASATAANGKAAGGTASDTTESATRPNAGKSYKPARRRHGQICPKNMAMGAPSSPRKSPRIFPK